MTDLVTVSENIPQNVRLTCIIPIRATAKKQSVIDRLRFTQLDPLRPDDIGFLVIDDGSERQQSEAIRGECRNLGYGYVKLDTETSEFSVGRCRNYGAMYARSKYILMHDADLMPYKGLYRAIINEIDVQGLDNNSQDFLMFGYVFLTEKATEEFHKTPEDLRQQTFLHYAWKNNPEKIEKVSTGTSANLYNREFYLARGGNSPDFEGWGYEDLEFNTRMIRISKAFPIPRNWTTDRKNFSTIIDYDGWKAVYRLFGDTTFYKGITFFHAWHPVDNKSNYMQRKEANRLLFTSKMEEFVKSGKEPDPLPSKVEGKTLLFRTNPFVFHREFRPKLGDTIVVDEKNFSSAVDFGKFIKEESVTRVMFHNPYHSPEMLSLYEQCRTGGIPFIVAERGALNNTLFFDPTGFLADGTSYARERWDRPLANDERDAIISLIRNTRIGADCLEKQGARVHFRNFERR